MQAWCIERLIRALFVGRVPKDVAICLLLLLWTRNFDVSKEWRFAEYFAGEAQVSGELRLASYPGVSLDVLYGGGGMDLLTPAGMGLAMLTILKLQPDSLGVLAPVCSSMGFLASSVTLRNQMFPLGDLSKLSVQNGNLLACRSILLCWIMAALGHVFLLEQPCGSHFRSFPHWRYFCKYICRVWRQKVWMRHWGADSCKPTLLWSNSHFVQQLSLGKLTKEEKSGTVPLAKQYVDSNGVKRCHGVKRRLIKSQVYTKAFGRRIASLFPRLRAGVGPLRNPQDDGGASGPALIKSLVNHDLWKNAKMDEVITYLADSKYVNLPEAYAQAFA